jgi:inner membrane protein involved in colicin E2 resistance
MVKRLVAIAFIFVCTSGAWVILGVTIMARTNSSDERLREKVQSIWGAPETQTAPVAEYDDPVSHSEVVTENGKQRLIEQTQNVARSLRPSSSNIGVELRSEPRQKGLLWYSTYKVAFTGDYEFRNPGAEPKAMRVYLRFPAAQAVYDDLQFIVNGQPVMPFSEKERAWAKVDCPANGSVSLRVRYKSQGVESWKYSFGEDVNPVQNFHLRMTTNFRDIDFPDNTLAPGEKRESGEGWQLDWNYANLISGYQIAMRMPEKLQPGPLASEISFFAPVSLFFFFFVIFIITTLRNIDLHPMNYFFLAGAFFAFHLLIAYLADHLDIHASFLISSAVSVFLVITYLRLVTGMRFAAREGAVAQFIYLVLFSYAFFFRGLTGLSITVGAILTLFVVMQMTGRIRWAEKFASFDLRKDLLKS